MSWKAVGAGTKAWAMGPTRASRVAVGLRPNGRRAGRPSDEAENGEASNASKSERLGDSIGCRAAISDGLNAVRGFGEVEYYSHYS